MADLPFQNAGAVYVISWQVDVLALPMSFDPEVSVPGAKVLRIRGLEAHDQLGFALAGGANVIGDSKPDLVIGAPSGPVPGLLQSEEPPTSGKAIVVDGAALGSAFAAVEVGAVADFALVVVQEPFPIPMPAGTNALLLRGEALASRFGHSVAVLGDLDAPSGGAAEIAVGATGAWWQCAESTKALQYVAAPLDRGSVKVYSITTLVDPFVAWVPTERKRLLGESHGDLFGFSISGFNVGAAFIGGDATGDGVPDLLVGAPTNDGSGAVPDVGEIYLYSGAALQGGGDVAAVFSSFGDVGSEYFGWDVAGGGDVDGDGLREFAGGSRNFSLPNTITPPLGCMTQAGSSEELYGRGSAIGRVRVFCGAPQPDGSHVQIDEFWGMQHKGHLGWSICWLPSMDGNQRTELLMGMAGYQTCTTCAQNDPGAEIGRGQVWFY